MTQDSEARRSAVRGKSRGALPGLGPTIAVAVISAVICWIWLALGRASPLAPAAPDTSVLAKVEPGDITGALTTMNLPNSVLARFRAEKDDDCRRPLAWVTLTSAAGEPPSHIRLISGTYFSPVFEVSPTPVRVAIPFPAPYETGHGVLTAIDVGGSAKVSLLPAWRVSAEDGRATRAVTWNPVKNCSPRNG